MNARLAGHRHQERHLVHAFRLMREHRTHPTPALAMLRKFKRALHHRACRGGLAFGLVLRSAHLPVLFCELGLVVERVHLAHAAVHEKLDDAPDFRGVMQPAVELGRPRERLPCENVRERHTRDAASAVAQKLTSRNGIHVQFRKRNSLLLKSTRRAVGSPCLLASAVKSAFSSAVASR